MDTAILSSRVYQGDPAKPWAEAVAMRDGRVVAVGSNADVKQACGRERPGLRPAGAAGRPRASWTRTCTS